jgi:tetratricopeptide (TPR) repeat protein
MADLIKIIKTDDDPSVVLRSYTRACALNRMDPELNSAYMRRMLLLGRPRAAYMSARILSAQDADAALAWAMIGYMMGRSNKYLDALTATARALEFNSDDPSILNNAGQLAAWFDNAPAPPKLGDREKRIMDKLKDKFAKSQVYIDAYKRVNTVYVDCKTQRADLQDKLTTAETEYNKTRTEELTMRANIARINSQIIQQNKKIDELEKDIRRNRNRLNVRDELGRYVYNHRNILAENVRLQNALNAAEKKKDALRTEGAPMVPKIRIATAMGIKLRKDASGYRKTLKSIRPAVLRQLRWDPPAVDGVFTAEAGNLPRRIKPKPTTRTGPKVVITNSETAAAKKLRIAKLYISNNKIKYARNIILEIFEKYPKTKAAAEARALLVTISPEPTE